MTDDTDLDDFYVDGIAEIERLHEKSGLERLRADGVRVEIDMAEDTSLRRYVNARRAAAVAALEGLAHVAADNPLDVARLQHVVSEYLNVRDWIRQEIENSIRADEMLQQDHHGESTDID